MSKSIAELQSAFQAIVKILKKNKKVLAILTYGSIVSGDIWEESDIDLFIIYEGEYFEIRDLFSESEGVPVHAKILCEEKFLELYKSEGKRGFARNLLTKSKLIYSKSEEVTEAYNRARYSDDPYSTKWNLVYLGNVIKDLGVCKKYLINGGINTSYEVLVRVLDGVSKLFINLNGYSSTKDSLAVAMNLDQNIRDIAHNLFNKEISKDILEDTIKKIEMFIDENIINASKLLLEYLYQNKEYISSYEVSKSDKFKEFNIEIEQILKELAKRNLVIKDKRLLRDSNGVKIMGENVYLAKVRNE